MFDLTPPSNPAKSVAGDAKTIGEMFLKRAAASASRISFSEKSNGQWQPTTWSQFADRSQAIACYLIANGFDAGQTLGILGATKGNWILCDIAGHLAGGVTVGAYPTLSGPQLAYLFDHSDSKFIFVDGQEDLDKVLEIRADLPQVQKVIVWETDASIPANAQDWVIQLAEVLQADVNAELIEQRVNGVNEEDTAVLVYTSGTTGPPKGAMISHKNIMTMMRHYDEVLTLDTDDHNFSFLPMAHVAERILAFYGRIATGTATSYASSIPKVLEELQEVRPTIFGSVPRIYEKAYTKVFSQVEQMPPHRQAIFHWAVRVGRKMVQNWQQDQSSGLLLQIQYALAKKLVLSKVQDAFGGRVKMSVTGAAPIALEILEFFWAAGIPIYEAYGMTEGTAISHCNRPGHVKLGSVGLPLGYTTEKLAEDGEILVKGDCVFKGYYKNPDATAEMVQDGWLHTGDVGRQDANGFMHIVDRKKHIIITAGGKNISPANIENEVKSADNLISQCHVHGDKRKFLVALVTLHPTETLDWGMTHGVITDKALAKSMQQAIAEDPLSTPDGMDKLTGQVAADERIRDRIAEAVRKANGQLSKVETIKRIVILDRDFRLSEDEITPTLKLKRKAIETKFADTFDRTYDEPGFAIEL